MDNISDAIMEINIDGTIEYVSPSHYKIFGREELPLGQSAFKYLHPEDENSVWQAFQESLQTGNIQKVEYRWLHPEQGYIWLEAFGKKYLDGDGNIKVLATIRDINKRKLAEEKVRYLSLHDELTGLYNRTYLKEEIERIDTERQLPISIILLDVNGLKLVNDTYGHYTGDRLLVNAAKVFKDTCRSEDIILRWGGDEFVIFLPQTSEEEAQKIIERIKFESHKTGVESAPLRLSAGAASKNNIKEHIWGVLSKAEDIMYRNKLVESEKAYSDILSSFVSCIRGKSFETEEHITRMQKMADSFGRELGLSDTELKRLCLFVSLHDIGKVVIPEKILQKPGRLNDEEWEILKKHSETGYRIAKATNGFAHIAEEILANHEKWDGSGYPRGLSGHKIPLLARILAIIDAYDVMVSGRPYKKPLSKKEALDELKKCSGTQFDPRLTKVFTSLLEKT